MLVRDVMTTPAVTVTSHTTASTAVRLMHEEQITSLPVVDDRGTLLGVVGETDLQEDRLIGEIATQPAAVVQPDQAVDAALVLLRSATTLPVVCNDRVVGTICQDELLEFLSDHALHRETAVGTACGSLRRSPDRLTNSKGVAGAV